MFGASSTLWGCDQRQTYDRNRREVSNEKRCHRYLQRYSSAVWKDAAKTEEKLCPTSHQRLREKWNYSRPTSVQAQHTNTHSPNDRGKWSDTTVLGDLVVARATSRNRPQQC